MASQTKAKIPTSTVFLQFLQAVKTPSGTAPNLRMVKGVLSVAGGGMPH